jgi:hypothetical protein
VLVSFPSAPALQTNRVAPHQVPRTSPSLSTAQWPRVSGLVRRRDETGISALEWSRKGLAHGPFTSPSYPRAKAAQPLVDQAGIGSDRGCDRRDLPVSNSAHGCGMRDDKADGVLHSSSRSGRNKTTLCVSNSPLTPVQIEEAAPEIADRGRRPVAETLPGGRRDGHAFIIVASATRICFRWASRHGGRSQRNRPCLSTFVCRLGRQVRTLFAVAIVGVCVVHASPYAGGPLAK